MVSAIAGDPTRGVGILDNELYIGRVMDIDMARAELRSPFGSIRVTGDEREVRLEADLGAVQASLLQAAAGPANNVVAGAGSGLYLACRSRPA